MKFTNLSLFIACIILAHSCSKNDNDSEGEIFAKQYGYSVRGNITDAKVSYTYKFFDKESGEIYQSGTFEDGDHYNAELFDVANNQNEKGEVSAEIKILSSNHDRLEINFLVFNRNTQDGFLYILDWDQNPNAPSPFQFNEFNYDQGRDLFEGTYPLKASEPYWYVSGRDSWEDYKNSSSN